MHSETANPRVAYLINQYPKVSHSFVRREILALERNGVDVHRFALRGWDAELVDPEDVRERDKTRHTLKNGFGPVLADLLRSFLKRPGPSFGALKLAIAMSRKSVRSLPYHLVYLAHAARLYNWVADAKVEHLHAHFGTNSADVALLLNRLGGPTFSFTIHGPDELDNAPFYNLDRKLRGAKFAAAISGYTRSQVLRHIEPADWSKVKVVHCGLESDFFADTPAPLTDAPVLLCIGRLSSQKGHLILLDAFAALRRAIPDARLILAGDGELRPLIEKRLGTLGLTECVTITGWVSSDDVRRLIQDCRILVQPSLMEGLPVVIMEAMAQGRVAISTYIAGIPELVETGKNGWLVVAASVDGLAAAMKTALELPTAELERMGADGAARVKKRHSIDGEAAKLKGLFLGDADANRAVAC